jgi:hypothetical protein
MRNENQVTRDAELSQHLIETIFKLVNSGSSPEAISFSLELEVEMVRQVIANDPKQMSRMVESLQQGSRQFRCALSQRLMTSPVMARDENYYEQSILEADPSLSREQFMPSRKLKEKIADFSKESLKVLETCLKQTAPHQGVLELTAECLSVLSFEAETDTLLRVLGAVEGEALKRLAKNLRDLLSEEKLLSLIRHIAKELPSDALCLAWMEMLEPRSENGFEEAFRSFNEVLSLTGLVAGAIELAEEISEKLSRPQLTQMNSALAAHPRECEDRLERLRLKEAYLRLREGDTEGAVSIVSSLHRSSCLDEVLRFYDEAGLSSEKLPILEQRLSANLEVLSRESPSVAETISTVRQLLSIELMSRHSEPADQQSLANLRIEVAALHQNLAKAKEEAKQAQIAQDTQTLQTKEAVTALLSLKKDVEALQKQVTKTEKEAKEVQGRVERTEGWIGVLQREMQDFKLNFLRTEEAIKTDLNFSRDSIQPSHLRTHPAEAASPDATLEAQQIPFAAHPDKIGVVPEEPSPYKIFSYNANSSLMHWTDMETGEHDTKVLDNYTFPYYASICEVPGSLLFVTGGRETEVVSVHTDTLQLNSHSPMLTARQGHGSAYFEGYLYVIAGTTELCERYDLEQNTWTAIPPLSSSQYYMGVVVLESTKQLFSIGG